MQFSGTQDFSTELNVYSSQCCSWFSLVLNILLVFLFLGRNVLVFSPSFFLLTSIFPYNFIWIYFHLVSQVSAFFLEYQNYTVLNNIPGQICFHPFLKCKFPMCLYSGSFGYIYPNIIIEWRFYLIGKWGGIAINTRWYFLQLTCCSCLIMTFLYWSKMFYCFIWINLTDYLWCLFLGIL